VEAILEATADILVRHGYAKLTTNRIAERAGVNIASLYQYFPGKDAIVAELRRRHGAEQRAAVRKTLAERPDDDLESTLRALVSGGIAAHTVAPELHQAFTEQLPALGFAEIASADPAPIDDFRRFLKRAAVGVPDPELALWIVATAAGAVLHRAAVERPRDLRSGAIRDELVTLLVRYLRRR
jgi:AcrR family transcriptional regulator